MLVEVCANSLESALNAQKAGADRIEICTELGVGGLTPSYGLLKGIKAHISIAVHVLIRPRSGDFTYSESEFENMKEDILLCKELSFQGVVSGILNADYTLDIDRTKELIGLAKPLDFTFHRAFDWVRDPFKVLVQLEDLGAHTLLTSGQRTAAIDGMELLSELKRKASTISILPGGGINETNAKLFREEGFKAIHLSGTKFHPTLATEPPITMNSPAHLKENSVAVSNRETIEKVVRSVK